MLNIREQQPSGFENAQPLQVAKHVKSKQCLLGKTKSKAYAGKCCISFLFLLQQITTNIEAINNTNLVSYNLVVRSPKCISDHWNQGVTRAAFLLGALGENLFLAFFSIKSYPQSLAHGHINLPSGYVITFPSSDSDSPGYLIRTHVCVVPSHSEQGWFVAS